jgi:hypothetical protein
MLQERFNDIKLKLSSYVEGDVEENQRCYAHTTINATTGITTIDTAQAKCN